jgi:mono/diheme cytochrome c family protein
MTHGSLLYQRNAPWFALAALSLAWMCVPGSVRAQDAGEKVYKAKCAMCHGPDGGGNTPAGKGTKVRDLCSDDVKKETDQEWTDIISKGKNKMPSYEGKISADEMKAVVAYMRSLCKK